MAKDHSLPRYPTPEGLRQQFRHFLFEPSRWSDTSVPGSADLKQALKAFRHYEYPVYAFGGLPRDLAYYGAYGAHPRDLDFVIEGASTSEIVSQFQPNVCRENRFGGVKLRFGDWNVDVWPLHKTWAFRNYPERWPSLPGPSALPETTFLNVEAIAVGLTPTPGKARPIYEEGFFTSLKKKLLDINFEPNPNPDYCVLRSLLIASQLQFDISKKLVKYVIRKMESFDAKHLVDVQVRNYGEVRLREDWIENVLSEMNLYLDSGLPQSFRFSSLRSGEQKDWLRNVQLGLFP